MYDLVLKIIIIDNLYERVGQESAKPHLWTSEIYQFEG